MIQMLEGKRIDLNSTPQDFFTTKELPIKTDFQELKKLFSSHFRNAAIPIIVVGNFRCGLAWMIFDETGSNCRIEICKAEDQARLGISDNMLYDAIEDWGGSSSINGNYPINSAIRYKLAEML